MQNYLHEQKESITSITPNTIKAMHQILQTLIQMCVGNFANQEVIFNKQIMNINNHILQLDITNIKMYSDEHFVRASEDVNCSNVDTDVYLQQMKLYKPRKSHLPRKEATDLRKEALDLKGSAVELLEAVLKETSQNEISYSSNSRRIGHKCYSMLPCTCTIYI